MTDFLEKLAQQILGRDGYKKSSDLLFSSYIKSLISSEEKMERSEVKKLITSTQALYNSENKYFRDEGAILLAMLLDTCANDYPDIIPIAYSMFANSGNFPNIKLLTKRHPELDYNYSFYSEAQMDFRESLNTVPELGVTLTDFQRSLWEDLSSDKDVITSAPTSAGKTYIILNYLLNKVVNSDGAFAAIIVPTRALISEVAGKVYELATSLGHENEIEICTVPTDKERAFASKTFFVMTQERLHEILLRGDLYFNYLFIDEAHNITDMGRGVLLHITIEKMLDDSLPQVIISMPSSKYQNSFSSIFKGIDFRKEITNNSPVAKIIISVIPKGTNLILSRHNSENSVTIEKGFRGKGVHEIVYRLGKGESNIIYRNRTDYCESMADKIAELIPDSNIEENQDLEEAASYVEEFVHEKFSLASNLRKGVAFHYGPLPSSIRVMIENLVKSGDIKYIACTSTLAEGVNLPAKNLFLENPQQQIAIGKPWERLDDVKISNITGRAGRMLNHFSGNVFLIEPDKWKYEDYFEEDTEEEDKIPTYFKSLNEELTSVLNALKGVYSHEDEDQYRLYTVANKLIKELEGERLEDTLSAPELALSYQEKEALKEGVQYAYDNLKIATFTLDANPTVGYIQQNKLYDFLQQQKNYEDWVLLHPQSADLYDNLMNISNILQQFGVYRPADSYSLGHMCSIARKWVRGDSLKSIISDQISWDLKESKRKGDNPKSVNQSVRNVVKVINNDVRFRLSNALKCYQVLLTNILVSKGVKLSNVKLHSFIEVGASNERMISLINLGLSREAAHEIHEMLSKNVEINTSLDLLRLYNNGRLNDIHTITKKELTELFT